MFGSRARLGSVCRLACDIPLVERRRGLRRVPVGGELSGHRRSRDADRRAGLWQAVGFAADTWRCCCSLQHRCVDSARTRFRISRRDVSSASLKRLAVAAVLAIDGFYLVPQLKGAGIAFEEVMGAPYWAGIVVVGIVVSLYVALGGMRGVSYVQAFQFWVKTVTIALPAIVLLIYLGGIPNGGTSSAATSHTPRELGSWSSLHQPALVQVPGSHALRGSRTRGVRARRGGDRAPIRARSRCHPERTFLVPSGTPAQTGSEWARPVTSRSEGSPLYIYSLLLATFLGTMGLPHILVRFYTNPDGPAARRTTVRVLALLSVFYLFPAVYGALGRALAPGLYLTGQTDTVVLTLPAIAWPGTGGNILAR